MDGERTGETIRQESAVRYAEWVNRHLKARGWKQADLSRRSGIKKQTVSQIMRGESLQPTAWQIAGLARVFRVAPSEIYREIGLWEPTGPGDGDDLHAVTSLYRDLGAPARRAALHHLRAVREMQEAYSANSTRLERVAESQPVYESEEEPRETELEHRRRFNREHGFVEDQPEAAAHDEMGRLITEENAPPEE